MAAAFQNVKSFVYDPQPFGHMAARVALAELLSISGVSASSDRIFLTASTSEAYACLFALLCDSGDEILVPTPSYPLFEHLAGLACVTSVPYCIRYDGAWHVDLAYLRKMITSRTRALIVVNPNNPTGHFIKGEDRANLIGLCVEHNLALIADEVFLEYPVELKEGHNPSLATNGECLTFSLGGLSKSAGMPQLKLAWTITSGPQSAVAEACERLELILDAYLSVATPVEVALKALLSIGRDLRTQIQERVLLNLGATDAILACAPASRLHVEGGWSVIIRLPELQETDDWAAQILEQANVVVQPGYFFDLEHPGLVVLSLLTEPTEFRAGLQRMCELAARQSCLL